MPRAGGASQGRFPTRLLAILVFLCWYAAAAPAAAQEIEVTSADPPAAEQGTVNLDVVIGGKGFKKGAVARFLLSGTEDPDGITVNSTTFKNAGQLIANITVADNASISKFDIEVSLASGRRGKGIELFAVQAKGSGTNNATQTLVWADFADTSGQRIRSDAQVTPCSYDYVDFTDPCTGSVDPVTGAVIPNAEQATVSKTMNAIYSLRMVPGCCVPSVNAEKTEWEPYVVAPGRWLVLDFSEPVGNSPCLGIDSLVAQNAATTPWEDLGLPTPQPPPADEDTTNGRCVDNVIVRFKADHALAGDGTATLEILIDEPQALSTKIKGKKSWRLQWNAVYSLVFRQPLLATQDGFGNTFLELGGCGECNVADLLDADGNVKGSYHMDFRLTLRRAQ